MKVKKKQEHGNGESRARGAGERKVALKQKDPKQAAI